MVHEILGFEIFSSEEHFCHDEISEILFRARGLDPWFLLLFSKNFVLVFWLVRKNSGTKFLKPSPPKLLDPVLQLVNFAGYDVVVGLKDGAHKKSDL